MKYLYWSGLLLLVIFEILVVWLIMPLPASQETSRVLMAWNLYHWRWYFRAALILLSLAGLRHGLSRETVLPVGISAILCLVITLLINFKFTADHMFLQPGMIRFTDASERELNESAQVLAVQKNGEAKAYPLRYLLYHHQVRDSIGGQPVMVTYCSVCRAGRVYRPLVEGRPENFRLAGMDLFNAMFEDETTGSWWRQANGEAIAGPMKGSFLPEVESSQMTSRKFFSLYPEGRLMLPDPSYLEEYDSLGAYETGKGESELTRTDSVSWNDKSWVVGLIAGNTAMAYAWNDLAATRLIRSQVEGREIVLILAEDRFSFMAFELPTPVTSVSLTGDTLVIDGKEFDFSGRPMGNQLSPLTKVKAYQEFWHSWRSFHPATLRYTPK